MKHLDLFSGIGGFALAVDWTWDDVEHVFCEIDPFCQAIIKKHWPNSDIHGDIKQFHSTGAVDLLTGGFPCQPFSSAGKQRGKEDDRDLWPEMFRVIKEAKPTWIIGENVAGFVRMELDRSISDLESEGYSIQAFIIPALAVNAPHRRDRCWIVAHTESTGDKREIGNIRKEEQRPRSTLLQRTEATNSDAANTKSKQTNTSKQRGLYTKFTIPNWRENWVEVATALCRVDDGIPRIMDRNPRLKALGNAIVPQVAAEIMKTIVLK